MENQSEGGRLEKKQTESSKGKQKPATSDENDLGIELNGLRKERAFVKRDNKGGLTKTACAIAKEIGEESGQSQTEPPKNRSACCGQTCASNSFPFGSGSRPRTTAVSDSVAPRSYRLCGHGLRPAIGNKCLFVQIFAEEATSRPYLHFICTEFMDS